MIIIVTQDWLEAKCDLCEKREPLKPTTYSSGKKGYDFERSREADNHTAIRLAFEKGWRFVGATKGTCVCNECFRVLVKQEEAVA